MRHPRPTSSIRNSISLFLSPSHSPPCISIYICLALYCRRTPLCDVRLQMMCSDFRCVDAMDCDDGPRRRLFPPFLRGVQRESLRALCTSVIRSDVARTEVLDEERLFCRRHVSRYWLLTHAHSRARLLLAALLLLPCWLGLHAAGRSCAVCGPVSRRVSRRETRVRGCREKERGIYRFN